MWDERYNTIEYVYGTEPNTFLVEHYKKIPLGKVLCLAEGEGRNAVFLSKESYEVTAVDQSSVGLKKANRLASENNVSIKTECRDLKDIDLNSEEWDGVVSIFAHVSPDVRKHVHTQVIKGLRKGGVFVLEGYTEEQLKTDGVGGPPADKSELFFDLSETLEELDGLTIILAREITREFNEGEFHKGPGAVLQIVAVKNG